MSASIYNFSIEQGSSFKLSINYKDSDQNPINLTGYCARLTWKATNGDITVFSSLETPNSNYSFTIDGPNGNMLLLLPISVTNNYDFKTAKYDLELQSPIDLYANGGKETIRILYGTVTLIKRYSETNTVLDCVL